MSLSTVSSKNRKPVRKDVTLSQRESAIHSSSSNWSSPCCGEKITSHVIVFFTQVCISLLIMLFCLYKLTVLEECQDKQLYSSTLTGILTFWLPRPTLKT